MQTTSPGTWAMPNETIAMYVQQPINEQVTYSWVVLRKTSGTSFKSMSRSTPPAVAVITPINYGREDRSFQLQRDSHTDRAVQSEPECVNN